MFLYNYVHGNPLIYGNNYYIFQFSLDTRNVQDCLKEILDLNTTDDGGKTYNCSYMDQAGFGYGDEVNNCTNDDQPTSHFPEVRFWNFVVFTDFNSVQS